MTKIVSCHAKEYAVVVWEVWAWARVVASSWVGSRQSCNFSKADAELQIHRSWMFNSDKEELKEVQLEWSLEEFTSHVYVQLIVLQNSVGAKKEAVAVWLDSLFDLQSMHLEKGKLWHIHFGQYTSIPERAPWFLWGVTEHEDHPATFQRRKLTLVHGICVKSKSVNAMRLFKGPAVGQKQRTSSSPDRAHMKLGFALHHTACFPGDMTPTYPSCLRPNLWIPNLNCELEPARRPRWVLCAKALTAAKEIFREISLSVFE